ncbi:cycloisomerase [Devosia sp. A8/3-2]|nr:cycloisomerase [Devosia sp. A8/3-2]
MFAKALWAVIPMAATMIAAPALAQEEPPAMTSEVLGSYVIPEVNQGIGVDAEHFYAIDNTSIAKYTKDTRERVALEDYEDIGAIHFDSAAVIDGKIYVAHSNYPVWPMTSSLEIFDAASLDHLESHSFGIQIGSFTGSIRRRTALGGGFANYNRVFDKSPIAYGNKYNTRVVKFDADWQVDQAYVIPDIVVEKFDDMSNSGGSGVPMATSILAATIRPKPM